MNGIAPERQGFLATGTAHGKRRIKMIPALNLCVHERSVMLAWMESYTETKIGIPK